jgi:hypothetical protein
MSVAYLPVYNCFVSAAWPPSCTLYVMLAGIGNTLLIYFWQCLVQDKSPFYAYLMTLVLDPEYMKLYVDTQNRVTDGATGESQGRATRVRKAQLSVCSR